MIPKTDRPAEANHAFDICNMRSYSCQIHRETPKTAKKKRSCNRFSGLGEKNMGLSFNQYVGFIDRSGYLAKRDAAMKQLLEDMKKSPVPLQPPVPAPDPAPYPPMPGPGPQPMPPTLPQPPQPTNRHFSMMTTLDSTRVVKNISTLMD